MEEPKLLPLLERALNLSSLRQQILANNVANVDTPDYKRFDVSLTEALQAKVKDDPGDYVYRQQNTSLRVDGNNVDIDQEMAQVAKNNLYFDSVATSIGKQLSLLRYLINEGRR